MSKRNRNSYDVMFKLEVVEYAKENNNCQAERKFGVSEKMVRDWRSKETKLRDSNKSVKKMKTVLSPYDEMETVLNEWIMNHRSNGYIVTRSSIRLRALQLAKEFGHSDFKASAGWCTRFMSRRGLTLRQRTHIAQKLPQDVDDKVLSYNHHI